jgi:hypothetical protein
VGHGRRVCGLRVVEEGCVSCRTTHVMPANIVSAVSPSASSSGSWDSIHVFDAQDRARTAHYKLTSTVILSLGTDSEALGALNLSGNMVRQVEADMAVEDDTSHVANVGRMVEDMELKMRNLLQEVYFGKAKDVVGDLRSRCLCCACGIFADEVRYCVAQPDESRSCDAEGNDQQYGSVGSKLVGRVQIYRVRPDECGMVGRESIQYPISDMFSISHDQVPPAHAHLFKSFPLVIPAPSLPSSPY